MLGQYSSQAALDVARDDMPASVAVVSWGLGQPKFLSMGSERLDDVALVVLHAAKALAI